MLANIGRPLTRREKDVLDQVTHNCDKIKVLAENIQMTSKTFDTHLNNIYRKLGVRSRVELVLKLYNHPRIEYYSIDLQPVMKLINRKLDLVLERLNGSENTTSRL